MSDFACWERHSLVITVFDGGCLLRIAPALYHHWVMMSFKVENHLNNLFIPRFLCLFILRNLSACWPINRVSFSNLSNRTGDMQLVTKHLIIYHVARLNHVVVHPKWWGCMVHEYFPYLNISHQIKNSLIQCILSTNNFQTLTWLLMRQSDVQPRALCVPSCFWPFDLFFNLLISVCPVAFIPSI